MAKTKAEARREIAERRRTGGPAFPTMFDSYQAGFEGMSLRDWFAGQASDAPLWWLDLEREKDRGRAKRDQMYVCRGPLALEAAWSYQYADALLKERDRDDDRA